jgi:hypothetical protein
MVPVAMFPPPKRTTVLVQTGASMCFAAVTWQGWVTMPAEHLMEAPEMWWDRTKV